MDIISRLSGCANQAADAVSLYSQVKMEHLDTSPKHVWNKSLSREEDPVVFLEKNLYDHLFTGLLWEKQFEKKPLEVRMRESFRLEMLLCTP